MNFGYKKITHYENNTLRKRIRPDTIIIGTILTTRHPGSYKIKFNLYIYIYIYISAHIKVLYFDDYNASTTSIHRCNSEVSGFL